MPYNNYLPRKDKGFTKEIHKKKNKKNKKQNIPKEMPGCNSGFYDKNQKQINIFIAKQIMNIYSNIRQKRKNSN